MPTLRSQVRVEKLHLVLYFVILCVCFFPFCRSLLTQEGICLTLQADFQFLAVAYPYVARRLLTDEDPALRERLFQVRSVFARNVPGPFTFI
jgi:hypothetical protein